MEPAAQHNFHSRFGNTALIMDDDEGACALFARIAAECGYLTAQATNKAEFIEQYALAVPTMIILDVFLGAEDASDIFRFLRNQRYRLPVVLVTGYNPKNLDCLVADGLGKGLLIAGFVQKSSGMEDLRRLLNVYRQGPRAIPI
jgi:CheY-like chemotaxis protein